MGVLHGCDVGGSLLADAVWEHADLWNESHEDRGKHIEWVQDATVFGVFVACHHGDEKGVPDIVGPVSFGEIEKLPRAREAARVWRAFVKGLPMSLSDNFPEAGLWLVETEVA